MRLPFFLLITLLVTSATNALSQQFETPPTFKASSLLSKPVLSSPLHRVDETVRNDGYLNTYVIHSKFGDMTAVSTALLYTRIAEIEAMEKMEQAQGAKAFGGSLADKGKQTVMGAVHLVTDPLDTVGSALSGVGKMFARAHENLVESEPSKYEDSRVLNVIGYSQVKRDYAKAFGVDPYSTNQIMQAHLNALSEAGYAGSLTGTALQALIPGGVGVAVSGVSGTALLGSIDVSIPPADLRRANREALKKAGVPDSLARLLVNNATFTPTGQTALVNALVSMNASDKDEFVEFAAGTDNQDVALFRQRMAQMFAGYEKKVGPLDRFVRLGRFVGAMRPDGELVLAFPLDYLAYTKANADIMAHLAGEARALNPRAVSLWLTGKAGPAVKKRAKELGWKLQESASLKLLGTPY